MVPTVLEIAQNVRGQKDAQETGLQNCYLGFLKFVDFNPQQLKKRFKKFDP